VLSFELGAGRALLSEGSVLSFELGMAGRGQGRWSIRDATQVARGRYSGRLRVAASVPIGPAGIAL
jgi:hypothetical protein